MAGRRAIKRFTAARSTTSTFCPRPKEVVIPSSRYEEVVATLTAAARTGKIGDGKIFVYDLADAIRIRNDERGEAAL